MRLRQIKISGFKSFAELTTIEIPSSIVGIVGPNGCGKSNVIEAVRWALGEGKAGDLRCKSMSELIFAGSDNRNPAGRAMVELVFDNSDGTLQGPWGAYSEISVKRVLTRDNTSSYIINNQQVRATDVRDLFMGTGLGANSYAIISQGMVTEFAKDSPERRREYLEEAAGVSKYKKRRKEAESKLTTTRANLERVMDLQVTRRESVYRLKQEAEIALQYQQLDRQRKEKESLWWFVQMVDSQNAIDRINTQLALVESQMNKSDSELVQKKTSLSELREELNTSNIEVLAKTQALNSVEKEISTIEGNIRSIIDRRTLLQSQLVSYEQLLSARDQDILKQKERIHQWANDLNEKEEMIAAAEERRSVLEERQFLAEDLAAEKKEGYERIKAQAAQVEQDVRHLSTEIAHLVNSKNELTERLQRFKTEASQTTKPDEGLLQELKEELELIKEESLSILEQREQTQEDFEQARLKQEELQEQIREKEQKFAALQARLVTLRELLEKDQARDQLHRWLNEQGLSSMTRLFEVMQVQAQWTTAVEAVLRERINAIGITRLQTVVGFTLTPPPAKLTFYCSSKQSLADRIPKNDFRSLDQVLSFDLTNAETENILRHWLSHYLLVDSVQDATQKLELLPAGCHFVTPQGHIIDGWSINFWAEDAQTGLLSRRSEILSLQDEESQQRRQLESLHSEFGKNNLNLSSLSNTLRGLNTQLETARRRESELALEVTRMQAAMEAYRRRHTELASWIDETKTDLEEVCARSEEVEGRFEQLDEALAQIQDKAESAKLTWEKAQEDLRQAQQDYNVFAYSQREAEISLQNLRERLAEAQRSQMVSETEQKEWIRKINEVRTQLNSLDEEGEKEGLQELLKKREIAQLTLTQAQVHLKEISEQVLQLERQLSEFEDQKRLYQAKVTDYLAKRQQYEIDFGTVKTRLQELNYDENELRESYERERPKQNQLKLQVEHLAKAMAALGAVNHAALEQLEIQTAEVERIDREVEDLQQAINTIETAIRRIDQETRSLLMNTFNRVNEAFHQKFVELFKGGQARLAMTSDDALEAGIEMYANPPGKHPHSIRQLSGGELTLTATALIFAFFTLNPAPFCLLDEVDAPLDEANQERLSRLIGSMSQNTQFMMITHHRVTMEHTNQLIGVTMKEPGVSRVVSVDIKQASQYVQNKN